MGQISPEKLEAMRSIGVISRRSGPIVKETRTDAGRVKRTQDELGNVVTERPGDRQDVLIRAPKVQMIAQQKEIR